MLLTKLAMDERRKYLQEWRKAHPEKPTEEQKKKRAEYMRNWRKAHPEKQAQYYARYWAKRANEHLSLQEQGEEAVNGTEGQRN